MTVHSHGCYNRLLLPRFVLEILGPMAARDGEGVASSAQPLAKHFPGSLLSLPRLLKQHPHDEYDGNRPMAHSEAVDLVA